MAIDPIDPASIASIGQIGYDYDWQLRLENSPVYAVTWAVIAGAIPTGLSLNVTGQFSGWPTAAGPFTFTVQAERTDTHETTSLPFTVTIATVVLVLNPAALGDATLSIPYSDGPNIAPHPEPDHITWSILSGTLPAGLSIDATSGNITGTPIIVGLSSFTMRALVTGTAILSDQPYSINVINPTPPTITTTNFTGNASVQYAYFSASIVATGSATIVFTLIAGALPAGVVLGSNGSLSGAPTVSGTFNFTVQATNAYGLDTQPLTLVISNSFQPGGQAPLWGNYQNATLGALHISPDNPGAARGDNDFNNQALLNPALLEGTFPFGMRVSGGALPTGITLADTGGSFNLRFDGIATAPGVYSFDITATNIYGEDTATFAIAVGQIVDDWTALASTDTGGRTYCANSGFAFAVPALIGTRQGAFNSTIVGSHDPNLAEPSTRAIRLVPYEVVGTVTNCLSVDTDNLGVGSYSFSLFGQTSSPPPSPTVLEVPFSLTINITDCSAAPGIDPITASSVILTGNPGVHYTTQLELENSPTYPVAWAVCGGALPTGLTLDTGTGIISGTPAALGPFTFTICATRTDTLDTTSLAFTITISLATTAAIGGGASGLPRCPANARTRRTYAPWVPPSRRPKC